MKNLIKKSNKTLKVPTLLIIFLFSSFSTVFAVNCTPPASGDWTVPASCSLSSSYFSTGNITVPSGKVLTIPNGKSLFANLTSKHITVSNGGGINVVNGGKIDSYNSYPILDFPIPGSTPYNRTITSFFDHSIITTAYKMEKVSNICQNVVYNGAEGEVTADSTAGPTTAPRRCYDQATNLSVSSPAYYSTASYSFNHNFNWALAYYSITSLDYDGHDGIDYNATSGTTINAPHEGTLTCDMTNYKMTLAFTTTDTSYSAEFLHISACQGNGSYAKGVKIGETGNQGGAVSAHLHFGIKYGGIAVDPYGWNHDKNTLVSTDPYARVSSSISERNLWTGN